MPQSKNDFSLRHLPFRFAGSAAKVTKSFEDILEHKIASIAAFGVTLTAYALDTNSTWPFVTLPNFQQRSASSRSLSGSLFHNVLPIVREEQRLEWEAYVSANNEWIFEARQIQTRNGVAKIFGDIEYTDGDGVRDQTVISSKIFDFETVAFYLDNGVSCVSCMLELHVTCKTEGTRTGTHQTLNLLAWAIRATLAIFTSLSSAKGSRQL